MWLLWLYLLNTVLMLIVAIREVRKPATALNWLVICLVLPVVGFAFYLISANPGRIRHEKLTSHHNESDNLPESLSRSASVIFHALQCYSVQGLQHGQVQILNNGIPTYEALAKSIQNAQKTIYLEYYLFRNDQIGIRITDLLIERASAGVKVRFLRDGWGSRKFPQSQLKKMMEAGIECRTIFPLRFLGIFSVMNYRDHCKIVVIDGKEAFTGGINIGYEYTGLKPDVGFWRDIHVRILGEPAVDLQKVFLAHWNNASPERIGIRTTRNSKADFQAALAGSGAEWASELGTMNGSDSDIASNQAALHEASVQTIEENPGIPTQVIREVYFHFLTQASDTIDIATPYLLADADIIMAMKTAVARGVRVRLLVPQQVDPATWIAGAASRTYYGELLEAGVQIYLYNKGMLHAKLIVADGQIAGIGSANYDMRSFRMQYEVCEVMYSAQLAQELTEQFQNDLQDSTPLRLEDLQKRSLVQRIFDQGARLLSPLFL